MLDPLQWIARQVVSYLARNESPWPLIGGAIAVLAALNLAATMGTYSRLWYRRLTRYYGYRKLFAVIKAAPLAIMSYFVASTFLKGGNDSFLSLLIWRTAWAYWWHLLVLPVRGYGFYGRTYSRYLRIVGWIVLAGSTGITVLTTSLYSRLPIIEGSGAFVLQTLLPLGVGALILFYPDLKEWIRSNPTFRRHLIAEGDCAGWLGRFGVAAWIERWPSKVSKPNGLLTNGIFIGWTTFESSYRPRDELVVRGSAHLVTCAIPGSGKKLVVGCVSSTFQSSCIYISTKSDLADEFCGRRVDQRLFEEGREHGFSHPGIDPRGITSVCSYIPRSRAYVADPSGQSRYAALSSAYNFLSDLDLSDPFVTELIMAIAIASFPDQPGQKDRFWTLGPRGFFASAIAFVLITDPNPDHHNLPFVADFCMGIDPVHGRSDPEVFERNLRAMMACSALDGFVCRGAANLFEQMGSNAYGSLRSEFENNTRWMTVPWMRQHLKQKSHFSYRSLGHKLDPVSVFLVPPRGDAALQTALPWLRTHAELSLQILQTTRRERDDSVLVVCDEFRQYGSQISAIRNGLCVLRDSNVRLWLFGQSWPSLELILGKDATAELEATSSLQFFGVNDLATARKISELLGRYSQRQDINQFAPQATFDVVTPAEVMNELRQSSNLQYFFPASGGPMRLERASYKQLKTKEGAWFASLPALRGHFDEPYT